MRNVTEKEVVSQFAALNASTPEVFSGNPRPPVEFMPYDSNSPEDGSIHYASADDETGPFRGHNGVELSFLHHHYQLSGDDQEEASLAPDRK
jgi:hypothetical protein